MTQTQQACGRGNHIDCYVYDDGTHVTILNTTDVLNYLLASEPENVAYLLDNFRAGFGASVATFDVTTDVDPTAIEAFDRVIGAIERYGIAGPYTLGIRAGLLAAIGE